MNYLKLSLEISMCARFSFQAATQREAKQKMFQFLALIVNEDEHRH
jgi:hypothetical protein